MKKSIFAMATSTILVAAMLSGCQKAAPSQPAESKAEEPKTEVETPAEVPQFEEYESADGWKVLYNNQSFFLNDQLGDGEVLFNYQGECSGTTAVDISYVADMMPDEVLYEKVAGIDDELVTRLESSFGSEGYWSHMRIVRSENQDPNAGDMFNESFIAIEHNSGTVLIDVITHGGNDEGVQMAIDDSISGLLDTFELVNHEPQTEYAYMTGSYVYETEEEFDGTKIEITEKITLNSDHTCVVSFQDDIQGSWTGDRIYLFDGSEYEFTVEGTTLMLNRDDSWVSFEKAEAEYAGSYVYETSDEIGGTKVVITEKIVLNSDHTCVASFQDDIEGTWTDNQIILNDGSEFEFTVEGTTLMLNRDDCLISFEKEA